MNTPHPLVSVIMPCYNHALFVRESMASILRQTVVDLELIVVDDASHDNSVEIVQDIEREDPRVKLVRHNENQGASASRNDGIRAAQGEYLAFCDADDLWKPDKLKRQIMLLSENPDYDVTYSASEIIDENGDLTGDYFDSQYPVPERPSGNLFEILSERNFVNMQTVVVRRKAVLNRLFFDEDIKWVEDWCLWVRLSRYHQFIYEPTILAQYRVHPQSTARTQQSSIMRNRWKVYKRNLKSHRDLPVRLQVRLWEKMGQELSLMQRHALARRFFCKAIYLETHRGVSVRTLLTLTARVMIEFFKKLAPKHSSASISFK